jgi:hypothetical protein
MAAQTYKRLTRERGPAQFSILAMSRSSLWLGDDHLLFLECTGYSETYKRFFFRDIQAFTIRKTKTRAVWNWVWGIFLVLSGLIIWAAASDWQSVGTIVAASIVLVVFGLPLLLNNVFGPTCACEIRTAVQTESLPSLCRLRKTQRIMNLVRPMIIAAQGQLTGEEVAARLRETVYAPATSAVPSGDIPPVIS